MKNKQALATFVTISGVVAVWTIASMRQAEQTEAISRQWIGEQWDVARQCIVGTPIGRGEDTGDRLVARAIETLVEASIAEDEPDPDRLWPARCVGLLSSLRVEPPVSRGDTSDAVGELEVLMPRVIDVNDSARTISDARELAESVAALDETMPPGAEYELDAFPDPDVDFDTARAIEQSFGCEVHGASRPFLRARAGGEILYDQLGDERLTRGDDGTVTLESPSGSTEIDVRGPFVRFVDGELAWLAPGEAAILRGDTRIELPIEGVPSAFAPCGDDWLLLVGEQVLLVRGKRAIHVRPTPPLEGVVWVCSEELAVFAWTEGDRWYGVRCGDACEPLPPLDAGGDLQLDARGPTAFAVGRGARGDLPLAWRLGDDEWSSPRPVLRGRFVRGEPGVLRACDETMDLAGR